MKTVKGVVEDGRVRVPQDILPPDGTEVLISFDDRRSTDGEEFLRRASALRARIGGLGAPIAELIAEGRPR